MRVGKPPLLLIIKGIDSYVLVNVSSFRNTSVMLCEVFYAGDMKYIWQIKKSQFSWP